MADRYDIHFQSLTLEEALTSNKIATFGYDPPIGVRGMQMCINLWLKILLTRRGSDPTNLARGTDFTNLIGSNVDLNIAEDVLRVAIDSASSQLSDIQRNDTTLAPREKLASAKLLAFIANPAAPGFDARVEILNQAGERLLVNIPDFARG